MHRYENGELYEADSIEVDESEKFVTPGGKVVYGGGGIVPDVFVPLDTTALSPLHTKLLRTGLLREFALDFAAKKREQIEKFDNALDFDAKFKISKADFGALQEFSKSNDIEIETSFSDEGELLNNLKALVARTQWNGDGFYPIINQEDPMVQAALKELAN
jgi:carboxyl-terminal processing protease